MKDLTFVIVDDAKIYFTHNYFNLLKFGANTRES
jgi:hypothetical protein